MHKNILRICVFVLALSVVTGTAFAQFRSTISGTVLDPNNAPVPNTDVTATNSETGQTSTTKSGPDGLYSFPNLITGSYELKAGATGFRPFIQRGITLTLNQLVRVDIKLELGTVEQSIEVVADASPLNFENATRQEGVTPETMNELPLIVSGSPRNAAQFAVLLPGVSTGGTNNAFDARINGGLQSGDEALMDGVSMQQGTMSQTGMISFWDFRMTPDMISEFKVLTANYEPQYGSTTSANIMVTTKSGSNEFHGALYEYLRNDALNALQWTTASDRTKPPDKEHDFGGAIGGPVKLPIAWSSWMKNYFYTNFEKMRITGGVNRPTLSIPSLKERTGDFSDWTDSDGALIPIFDPNSTRIVGGQIVRDQFMGCDGTQPNVICPSRIANSLANEWFKYLPQPTNSDPLNNYLVPAPVPDTILADALHYLIKIDTYVVDKHHVAATLWRQKTPAKFAAVLPIQLANESMSNPQDSIIERINYDYTVSPTLLNHFAFGYLNRNEGYGAVNIDYIDDLPKIPGVVSHNSTSGINLDGFQAYGNSTGPPQANKSTRPSYVANNLVTWVRGRHTWKFGGEYRNIGENFHYVSNEAGNFNFDGGATSIRGINSGSSVASFLLEQVASANMDVRSVSSDYIRADAFIWHVGNTWKVSPKLTLNLGIRWDMFRPTVEKYDRLSFFDPEGVNPQAGGRKGRLAFAGSDYGSASFGARRPEETFKKGFAPRIGIAYAVNDKTVVRTGYGLFYTQAFYPGWNGGHNLDGFNAYVTFGSTQEGLVPAFTLSDGFPQNYTRPPFISEGFQNGRSTQYRPFDANRLTYSQQWNLSIERQLGNDVLVSTAYVGTKGTRLPSQVAPLNALNPSLLSMGDNLYAQFSPGQAELNGVAAPYADWAQQLLDAGCTPSVAQALLPYPQYCSGLYGLNENAGNSTYHSLQLKVEKRFTAGIYLLGAYTFSKLLTDAGHVDSINLFGAYYGVFSPFERQRNKALANDDVPQVFNATLIYELPFGQGKKFMSSSRAADLVLGGWSVASITRFSSGLPYYFRIGGSACKLPGQFQAACVPAINGDPFAQDKGSFDPGSGSPLFNKDAFEPISAFQFYGGAGPKISNFRNYGFKNQDLAIYKNFRIKERMKFQIRGEFFNLFNWHNFVSNGNWGGQAFSTDLTASDFGQWNGSVTSPRNIQLGARFEF